MATAPKLKAVAAPVALSVAAHALCFLHDTIADALPPKIGEQPNEVKVCLTATGALMVTILTGSIEQRDLMKMRLEHNLIPGFVFSKIATSREGGSIGRPQIKAIVEEAN